MYRHEKANTVCTVMCYDTRCYFSVRSKADTDTQQLKSATPNSHHPTRLDRLVGSGSVNWALAAVQSMVWGR